jgi:hypothetical protein
MDFKEKLLEILGDDNSDKVEAINKVVPTFYVPKDKYNQMSDRAKTAESRVTELDAEIENTKNSQLTDQEKNQKTLKDAEKTKSEYAKKSNRLDAKEILINAGLKAGDELDNLLDGIVSENLDVTIKTATNLANTLSKTKENLEKKIQADLLNGTPRPDGQGIPPSTVLTKETFNKMTYTEKMKIYQTDPTKYKELSQAE